MKLIKAFFYSTVVLGFCVSGAASFGYTGHRIVARLADHQLTEHARSDISKLLADGNETLADISTWADEIKSNASYHWSRQLHYANSNDYAPTLCDYDYHRDCQEQTCLVGAIYNYTHRFQDTTLDKASREEALRFVVHFLGDLHQPLHLSARNRGGNGDPATFGKRKTSLHHVWDTLMIEKRIKDDFGNDEDKYVAYLIIDAGLGFTPSSLLAEEVNPDTWSRQINKMVCDVVYPDYSQQKDLSLGYYNTSIRFLEKLIILGGQRLAFILNDHPTNLD